MVPAFALLSVIGWLLVMICGLAMIGDMKLGAIVFWSSLCMLVFSIVVLWSYVAR